MTPPWLAEDVGVADQASGGRLELAFLAPASEREAWAQRVRLALTAWRGWRLLDGDKVPVTPPAQTFVPRLIVGEPDGRRLSALAGGALVRDGEPLRVDGALREAVRVTDVPDGDLASLLGDDPAAVVSGWRALEDDGEVVTLLAVLAGTDVHTLAQSLGYLGRAVVPALRCADFRSRRSSIAPTNGSTRKAISTSWLCDRDTLECSPTREQAGVGRGRARRCIRGGRGRSPVRHGCSESDWARAGGDDPLVPRHVHGGPARRVRAYQGRIHR
jgi:hypothetical protein